MYMCKVHVHIDLQEYLRSTDMRQIAHTRVYMCTLTPS